MRLLSLAVSLADVLLYSQGSVLDSQLSLSQDAHTVPMSDADAADDVPLTKNDAWHVITSYFDEKGLVRQQLDRSERWEPCTGQGTAVRGFLWKLEARSTAHCAF
jgi:hypothetical protein